MARNCTICVHDKRKEIEEAVVDPNYSYAVIANKFDVSTSAISRHREHMEERIALANQERGEEDRVVGNSLLHRLEMLELDAREIADRAKETDKLSIALQANREQQRIIEILLRVAGDLNEQTTVNITVNPAWIELRTLIFKVLENYPEARAALTGALKRISQGQDIIDGSYKELPSGRH